MMKNTTIKDVAQMAGVSTTTVSRYLSGDTRVNPLSVVNINDAIKKLKYVPNRYAQNLKRNESNIIAVIMPDISERFFTLFCKSVGRLLHQNKYLMMICATDNSPDQERWYIEEMLRNRVAGILISASSDNHNYLAEVEKEFKNIVLFDRYIPSLPLDVVCEDNVEAGYLLVKHMLSLGHRDFTLLAGNEKSLNTQYRLQGMRKAFDEAGLTLLNDDVICNIDTKSGAANMMADLIAVHKLKTCVVGCNPMILEGIALAANQLHLKIPTDYALCGFTVDDPQSIFPFHVPAILQNPDMVGLKAGELMLNVLRKKNQHIPKRIILDAVLCK